MVAAYRSAAAVETVIDDGDQDIFAGHQLWPDGPHQCRTLAVHHLQGRLLYFAVALGY